MAKTFVRGRKKGEAGAANNYITRRQALKKLQLTLKDFRRLCILKGIYPHDPLHKKKINKGSTENHIYYYRKDVNFLAHEPIINKFRDYKVFLRKLTRAKAKQEYDKLAKLHDNKPEYKLDAIVKERYPTFSSALRDLDDALCLCAVFSILPYSAKVKEGLIDSCKKLLAEFMHYVIESHSLKNTFISIKGIYYQAEIQGEKITWLVPHERGVPPASRIDISVLVTFAEFYVVMMGFVNFRLYQLLGLYYPPQIQTGQNMAQSEEGDDEVLEKIYSLAKPLAKRADAEKEEEQLELFDDDDGRMAAKVKENEAIKNLFKGLVFYLNRETPKEALTLIIRNCGGSVGWESGPTNMEESSRSVTHQVVDRPVKDLILTRKYVQPQWIFDCLNARRKLPTEKYMPGATLPPHFSPFTKESSGDYIPVERLEELRNLGADVSGLMPEDDSSKEKKKQKPKEKEKTLEGTAKGMRVALGKMHVKNAQIDVNEEGAQLKLREMMIPKKHRRVYHSVKKSFSRNRNTVKKLQEKRKAIDGQKAAGEE
ncbi:hypothetical protein WR25_08716 [Diploscapter pachys]|uniref:Pescadillo homolog n=1 Tax=Diploscapter pachys TaxID=2018661 RepID=A0A2A2L052_9BILA|nr:hypothetical protein WR25_08716 [Diploscapter pachys]